MQSPRSILYEMRRAYLEYRTMNAILASVTESAAIMRSPSFSRSCESRTIMNSPFSRSNAQGPQDQQNPFKRGKGHRENCKLTECCYRIFNRVEL